LEPLMADAGNGEARVAGEIQAVDRAAQILRLFGPERPRLTAAEAAELLQLNRTTTYRYCVSLVAAGLLERGVEPGTFTPGALLVQLGAFAIGRRQVVDLASGHMRSLSAATGLTSVLSLWGSMGPIVSRVEEESTRSVVVTVRVGTQLSLASAQAKIFLAHQSDRDRAERLLAVLPDDLRAQVRREIRELSVTGEIAVGADGLGIHAVAAPVFDEYSVCASLALIGTNDMLPLDVNTDTARRLRDAASALSREMGGAAEHID
jgi:DNA-binding IclR family transcriptional regulator